MDKGYIQIYTGNGKGKTTAAIGLAMRAIAAGFKVFFGQFMKNTPSGEQKIFDNYKNITFARWGMGKFIMGKPSQEDIRLAEIGFSSCTSELLSGKYDVVVLDELNMALSFGLIKIQKVIELLKNKPIHTEVIITGRNAPQEIIEIANLVSSIDEIKHYYSEGVQARIGIEE